MPPAAMPGAASPRRPPRLDGTVGAASSASADRFGSRWSRRTRRNRCVETGPFKGFFVLGGEEGRTPRRGAIILFKECGRTNFSVIFQTHGPNGTEKTAKVHQHRVSFRQFLLHTFHFTCQICQLLETASSRSVSSNPVWNLTILELHGF